MEKLQQGEVVAVGPGSLNVRTGQRFPVGVKPGDKVLLPDFGGTTFKVDQTQYSIFHEHDLLCVLHDT
jgi:chaperonin GroES